jgi:hypothetical protein
MTYIKGSVALEGAVINLHIGTTGGINGSALEVACPPRRELERKFEIVILTQTARMELENSAKEI